MIRTRIAALALVVGVFVAGHASPAFAAPASSVIIGQADSDPISDPDLAAAGESNESPDPSITASNDANEQIQAATAPGPVVKRTYKNAHVSLSFKPVGWGIGIVGTLVSTTAGCAHVFVHIDVVKGIDPAQSFGICGSTPLNINEPLWGPTKLTATELRAVVYQICTSGSDCDKEQTVMPVPELASTGSADYALAKTYVAMPLADFLKAQSQRPHSDKLSWSSNGCSTPIGVDSLIVKAQIYNLLTRACERHDFGYANLGSASAASKRMNVTPAGKLSIDKQFLADVSAMCLQPGSGGNDPKSAGQRSQSECLRIANEYYAGVRGWGGVNFFGKHFAPTAKITTAISATVVGKVATYPGATKVTAHVTGSYLDPAGLVTIYEYGRALSTQHYFGVNDPVFAFQGIRKLTGGVHTFTITYKGDGLHLAKSVKITLTVPKASASIAVNAPSHVVFGHVLDVRTTISGTGDTPTGKLTVRWSATQSSVVTLSAGVGVVHLSHIAAATYTLTVTYSGDQNYSPVSQSTTVSVYVPGPNIYGALSSPGSWFSIDSGKTVIDKAFSSNLDITTDACGWCSGTVSASEGAKKVGTVGTVQSGTGRIVLPKLTVGTHILTVSYVGSQGEVSTMEFTFDVQDLAASKKACEAKGGTWTPADGIDPPQCFIPGVS